MMLCSKASGPLKGQVTIPGDKSISHRALIIAALAVGKTLISGLLESDDVMGSLKILQAMGVIIEKADNGDWVVYGLGTGGLLAPQNILDMGNSGTSARLFSGVLAAYPFMSIMTGDASLRRRPMGRVAVPLSKSGALFTLCDGERLPMVIQGTDNPLPLDEKLDIPSAQIKSALLLFGLHAPGETRIYEKYPTRDHSEIMLHHFGADIICETTKEGGREIFLTGQQELQGKEIHVPADISSAAFMVAASLIIPDSVLTLPNIGLNPQRDGFLRILSEMGADIQKKNRREINGETVADLEVRSAEIKAIDIPPEYAPSMIDEYPILAMIACCAEGKTRMNGIRELRVKESDRLNLVAEGLKLCGVDVSYGEDWLEINGQPDKIIGGAEIDCCGDHRIAMSFLILGLVSKKPIHVTHAEAITTSFPSFLPLMQSLGADIKPAS